MRQQQDPIAHAPTSAAGKPLVVVFNLGSGQAQNHAQAVRSSLQQGCALAGRALHLLEVTDAQTLPAVARQAVAQAQQLGAVVVAAGGDGTINTVAHATLGSGCAFGVLPQGTFNYFSRGYGIPADTAQALQVILAGHTRPVQVGQVGERIFLVNASLGLYPQLLKERETWKRQFGRSRLVAFGAGLVTMLRGHRSLRLRVQAHGEERGLRTPTLFVGNNALQLSQLGLPAADDAGQGLLAVIALRPVGRLSLLSLLLRGAFGRLGDAEELIQLSTKQLTVASGRPLGALGSQRIKVATDGEVAKMKLPLTFGIAEKTLNLLCPPQAGITAETTEKEATTAMATTAAAAESTSL